MIKAIIFDCVEVLTTKTLKDLFAKVPLPDGVTVERLTEVYKPLIKSSLTGVVSSLEVCEEVVDTFDLAITAEQLSRIHTNLYADHVNKELINYMHELGKNYRLCILTNFGDNFRNLAERAGFYRIIAYDDIFISSEIGLKKPAREVFEFTLNKIGILPEEALFVDDRLENVKVAQRMGIHGIVFKNTNQFIKDLEEITG